MRFATIFLIGLLSWAMNIESGFARAFLPLLPDELVQKATLICNGTVLSVERTNIAKTFVYNLTYPQPYQLNNKEVVMKARIKILHTFKGKAPAEITFYYHVTDLGSSNGDYSTSTIEVDGPFHVKLEVGKRYRFFLKPDEKPKEYMGVLEGEYDDNYAVETLCPREADDSSFITKEEAIKLARAYVKSHASEEKADGSIFSVRCESNMPKGSYWDVWLGNPPGHAVGIWGDRTVVPLKIGRGMSETSLGDPPS